MPLGIIIKRQCNDRHSSGFRSPGGLYRRQNKRGEKQVQFSHIQVLHFLHFAVLDIQIITVRLPARRQAADRRQHEQARTAERRPCVFFNA
jgi:hypothetical protein